MGHVLTLRGLRLNLASKRKKGLLCHFSSNVKPFCPNDCKRLFHCTIWQRVDVLTHALQVLNFVVAFAVIDAATLIVVDNVM
jgi:hypothetical protein